MLVKKLDSMGARIIGFFQIFTECADILVALFRRDVLDNDFMDHLEPRLSLEGGAFGSIARQALNQLIVPVVLLRVKLGWLPPGFAAVIVKLVALRRSSVTVTPSLALKP